MNIFWLVFFFSKLQNAFHRIKKRKYSRVNNHSKNDYVGIRDGLPYQHAVCLLSYSSRRLALLKGHVGSVGLNFGNSKNLLQSSNTIFLIKEEFSQYYGILLGIEIFLFFIINYFRGQTRGQKLCTLFKWTWSNSRQL